MATGAGKKQSREARERTRKYNARQEFHAGLVARRRRDNLIAGIGGGALILAIVGGQIAYYTMGPGTPVPEPTPTPTTSSSPSDGVVPRGDAERRARAHPDPLTATSPARAVTAG